MPDDKKERLAKALKHCSDELAAWVEDYYRNSKIYPSEFRRYKRDIAPVEEALELLRKLEDDRN